ncbi:MAG: HAMP domain-containing protein [Anaerolineaceae bacterium]|nr:MAG: HAMP domain-containing protein [Anaerolineaceae bacterium]
MSIQNRLLIIYTIIFSMAFIVFAVIVYELPRSRILAQIDGDLKALATEVVQPGSLPEVLETFETASTLVIVADENGEIVARSRNLTMFNDLLDPTAGPYEESVSVVRHGSTQLRVYTVPLPGSDEQDPHYYLQVARLLDTYEQLNRVSLTALLMGFAAATASLFVAVLLTPGLFKPLEDMATAARQITRADDLSRRVPYANRPDEIGDLARAFNQTLERLERLFRTQQRLLADVSHELRTPLTTIRGNLDLMRRMGETDPQSLAAVQVEIERMTRLVGDLLLLARADSGGLPLERKPVELDYILFDVYRQVRILEPPVQIELTAVDQATVLGDADRLKQLLLNLVENAVKYTPPGGEVTLSLSKKEGWVYFEVSDTGIGIPPENLPHVFDRFYRVDKARTRAQGGSGLGLSIAKWVAQAHGGAIRVSSQVGEGTTFSVTLPLYSQQTDSTNDEDLDQEKTRPSLRTLGANFRR